MKLTIQDALAYPLYVGLVMSIGMGLAACTEQYQLSQQDKPLCLGEVQPRNTMAKQDIQEITDHVLMKK